MQPARPTIGASRRPIRVTSKAGGKSITIRACIRSALRNSNSGAMFASTRRLDWCRMSARVVRVNMR